MKKLYLLVLVVSIAACAPVSRVKVASSPATPTTTAPSETPLPDVSPEQPKPKMDLESFSKIETGMSLAEVEVILGKGELQSESEFGGLKTQVYSWHGGFMQVITVIFQDGVATSKSQLGLK